jgi:hypothetical protein
MHVGIKAEREGLVVVVGEYSLGWWRPSQIGASLVQGELASLLKYPRFVSLPLRLRVS